ncbi:MAG TPA: elongation factor P [Synergistetes bacterium]|nr:elongation factor P [Synergistota bacterium]
MGQVVDTSDFHSGMKIIWQEGIWEIVDCQHHKMGRGGAIVRTKLKNLENGSIVEHSFRSGERLERVIFEDKPAQFLYQDGENYVFMDMQNYDQIYIHKDILAGVSQFLKDNLEVELEMHEGRIMGIELPKSVELRIVDTTPGFKGDTVSGSGKPATLETGFTLSVPMFVEVGEVIIVDTRTGEYIERAKR